MVEHTRVCCFWGGVCAFGALGVLDLVFVCAINECVMGQTRDTGKGKQSGSHVDYVVEGALPENAETQVVVREPADSMAVVSVPIRPSKFLTELAVVPDGMEDVDAMGILLPMTVGLDPSMCARISVNHKVGIAGRPVYETVEEYLREVPEYILKMVAWYILFLETGKRVRELPQGFMRQVVAACGEYLVLGRLRDLAEKAREEMRRLSALDKLDDYSDDDRIQVRQSAVAAASKMVEHIDKREELRGGVAEQHRGGGFTLQVNVAAMLGKDDKPKVVESVEVIDAGKHGE